MADATPPLGRRVIVNADDFGQSAGINDGIIRCHEAGIVTSASLMVCWPQADAAAAYAQLRPALSVGLHVDLGEWVLRDGEWMPLYTVVATWEETTIRFEILRQLEAFRRLLGRDPSHLDSHQHVHECEPVRGIVVEIGDRLGIPCRRCSQDIRYCGEFYGQTRRGEASPDAIGVDRLVEILRALPDGTTELG